MTTEDASPLKFPCAFPIKVAGVHSDDFVARIVGAVRRFDAGFDESTVEVRPSRRGKYLGVTVTITAVSREQLDDVYRALTALPDVRFVI